MSRRGAGRWRIRRELKALMVAAMKLPDAVVARQLERNDLSSGAIGETQAQTIIEAGKALQQAGVLPAEVDVTAMTDKMIDPSYRARRRGMSRTSACPVREEARLGDRSRAYRRIAHMPAPSPSLKAGE